MNLHILGLLKYEEKEKDFVHDTLNHAELFLEVMSAEFTAPYDPMLPRTDACDAWQLAVMRCLNDWLSEVNETKEGQREKRAW